MFSIKKGTIPTRGEFNKCWEQHLPTRSYLEFSDLRVGTCSLPRDQVYEELISAHLDWINHTSDSFDAYSWMCHIMTILEIVWV